MKQNESEKQQASGAVEKLGNSKDAANQVQSKNVEEKASTGCAIRAHTVITCKELGAFSGQISAA